MGSIQDEIKKAEEAHAKRIAALKEKAAKEEARVREVMLDIFAEQQPDAFKQLRQSAVRKIDTDKKQRSAAAKASKAAAGAKESGNADSAPAASAGHQAPLPSA